MRKIIQIGLILAGIGMASYPWISNSLYEKEAGSRIQVYEKKSRELPKKNYQKSSVILPITTNRKIYLQ